MTAGSNWTRSGGERPKTDALYIKALERCGACLVLESAADGYLSVVNLPDAWQLPIGKAPTDALVFGEDLAAELRALKARAAAADHGVELETVFEDERYFRFVVEKVDAPGDADLMTTIVEVTEERSREQSLRDLLREVSHRSKNLLAIIQSIAAQTARHSETTDEFVQKFRGRIYSLALSQDLITESLWRGATFGDLVKSQISRYLPEFIDRVDVVGKQIVFPPNAALHLGLALHELALNAATHGGGVASEPHIGISCSKTRKDGETIVNFSWEETRNASTEASGETDGPDEPHFGQMVLERVLPASVSGTAHYQLTDSGVSYALEFPADSANE